MQTKRDCDGTIVICDEAPMSEADYELILGATARLERRKDPTCRCGDNLVVLKRGNTNTHAALFECITCTAFRGWMQFETARGVAEVIRRWGRPQSIILRTTEVTPTAPDLGATDDAVTQRHTER